jgi:hypothetical protein
MSSRWRKHKEDNPNLSDPPTLNENCAKYIISVMVLYLRQSASADQGLLRKTSSAIDSYFRDFELLDGVTPPPSDDILDQHLSDQQLGPSRPSSPVSPPTSGGSQSSLPIPQGSWIYEKTDPSQIKSPSSMNALIGKYTGRIVYHLSASNWTVVLFRLRAKIHYLAQTSEERPDVIDMSLMTHSALDRVKLIQVLNGKKSCSFSCFRVHASIVIFSRAVFPASEYETRRSISFGSPIAFCNMELDRDMPC